jgi:plastocyanin
MRAIPRVHRSVVLGMAGALALASALFGSTALAGDSRAVRVTGTETFVPNAKIMATFRFTPGPLTVRSGETVTWTDETNDLHTISVVAAEAVPATVEEVFTCPVCGPILAGHFDFSTNPPAITPVVETGAAGFDGPGDSLVLFPGGTVSAVVTAPAGSTLHYICAIHAWMQGTINVH